MGKLGHSLLHKRLAHCNACQLVRLVSFVKLDRTRRAWVAPARDGRYVLGQLRSRTAGVNLRSILDGIVNHYLNEQEIEKSRLFWGPGKSFLTSQNAVFFGTLKID